MKIHRVFVFRLLESGLFLILAITKTNFIKIQIFCLHVVGRCKRKLHQNQQKSDKNTIKTSSIVCLYNEHSRPIKNCKM